MAGEWKEYPLGEICSLITDGKHGDCRNEEGSGYYFLSVKDVFDDRLVYDNARQAHAVGTAANAACGAADGYENVV